MKVTPEKRKLVMLPTRLHTPSCTDRRDEENGERG
jgi:hypothetical protein